MRFLTVLLVFLYVVFCEGSEDAVEERGKKKKIGLFIYFVDLVIKKVFILKLIYAFAFWLLLHKAGYLFGWFLSYIKDKPTYHGHHDHHTEYIETPHYTEYGPSGPYRRGSQKPYNPYSSPSRKVNPY
uniref:SFRICE_030863 n=1 Tax=Spodoptera frugiperda TaxID=7108 RepID=A0A2H1V7T1_SPOFR